MSVERYLEGLLVMLSSLILLGTVPYLWVRLRSQDAPATAPTTAPIPVVPAREEHQ